MPQPIRAIADRKAIMAEGMHLDLAMARAEDPKDRMQVACARNA